MSLSESAKICFDCHASKIQKEKEEREYMRGIRRKKDFEVKKINHLARMAGESYGKYVARTETAPLVRASMSGR